MKIQELDGKNICILGFGREGQATLKALKKYAPRCAITIADQNDVEAEGVSLQTGADYLKNLSSFDFVVKAPGLGLADDLRHSLGLKLTNASQIFFDTAKAAGSQIIGITGSKGKSTTSTLIYEALKHGGKKAFLVGNIGKPMLDYLNEATPETFFVAELSSFQLEDMTTSPQIAVVTSFFPEHLDRHITIENYHLAKTHIAEFQTSDDIVFYNAGQQACRDIAELSPGQKVGFTPADFPLEVSETKLQGEHNRSNLAAAYKVALHLGLDSKIALESLRTTPGLPHRIQPLGERAGIQWVDDAFSTAPDAALAALQSLKNVDTLITGGLDRGGYDFTELAAYLAKSPVRNIVLFPETGALLEQAIEVLHPEPAKNYFHTSDMNEAVQFAAKNTKPGATCLLSSGAPSFNLFTNFEVRGQAFTDAVNALPKN